MKKVFGIIKGVISYILAILLTIVFGLFLNASVGWYMLIALILAPILSVFFAWLTHMTISVECEMEGKRLSKGDLSHMVITVKNKSIFPTTPIEIQILNGMGIKSRDKSVYVCVLPLQKKDIRIDFNAKICGKSEVGIAAVKVTDFLGLLSLRLKKINYEELKRTFYVIPDIADVSSNDERIIKIMQESLVSDDSEDTKENSTAMFGGFPGYDNREYVPGDPIKRINWKQSAKRGKLLIRLDDEICTNSTNVVLDSCYTNNVIVPDDEAIINYYKNYSNEEITAKIAEDAIENALGIIKSLVVCNYSVDFYAKINGEFQLYEIEDEKDVEYLRYTLSEYSFSENKHNRFPDSELIGDKAFVLSTPNSRRDLGVGISDRISVFSSYDEAIKVGKSSKKSFINSQTVMSETIKDKMLAIAKNFAMPYCLSLVLSIVTFDAFDVPVLSGWTLLQALVCGLMYMLCNFAKKRKFLGFLAVSVTVIGCLYVAGKLLHPVDVFLKWFMSGGEFISNTPSYLMILILILTVFFAIVIYFYTHVVYRTSVIMLISMIAFLIHIKVMRDVEIVFVMIVVALNVMAFLMCNRKKKDAGKRNTSWFNGLVSLILYFTMFIMIAYAVPKSDDTKYYHIFEANFLSGNTEIEVPVEYLAKSDVSGNADNIQSLNNRKIYEILLEESEGSLPYLRNNVFDIYDYSIDRWRGIDKYYSNGISYSKWVESNDYYDFASLNNSYLLLAMQIVEELQPGFLEKYGLTGLNGASIVDKTYTAYIDPWDIEYSYFIHPVRGRVMLYDEYDYDKVDVLGHKIYYTEDVKEQAYSGYIINFRDEYDVRYDWIEFGGANQDTQTSLAMLREMKEILSDNNYSSQEQIVDAYIDETLFALEYSEACEENNRLIPDRVRNLALEITKDCVYDWEKAEALAEYFEEGFYYDLGYDAKDDSVEYFLFEGRRGTCSDFASAYVLMARAVGLTVRYVEGYVPDSLDTLDDSALYEIRAHNAHAYPEVFIQNFGFATYEPTRGEYMAFSIEPEINQENIQMMNYVTSLVRRIIIIFVVVALIILLILFGTGIFGPSLGEKYFLYKVKKMEPERAVLMLYLRLLKKYLIKRHKNITSLTPYECAKKFEEEYDYDISPLTYLVENVSYQNLTISLEDRDKAVDVYTKAKGVIRKNKRN